MNEWNEFLKCNNTKKAKIPKVNIGKEYVEILDKKITMNELKNCLKKCKKKAPGHDGTGNEFLKALPESWCEIILEYFNEIAEKQEIPDDWALILINMIYKKGKKDDPKNYRPVTLICWHAAYSKIIHKYIE